MEKAQYFEELKETSNIVKPIIEKYLRSIGQKEKGLWDNLLFLAEKRLKEGVLLLKPFLVRLAYEITGGRNWEKISPICAAAEILNISSYQANLSFDGKFGQTQIVERCNQFIASMVTRELASDIANDMNGIIDHNKIDNILQSFGMSNKHIYIGQYYDLNMLNYQKYEPEEGFSSYLKLYLERCENLSGIFSEQCALTGATLSNACNEEALAMKSFGRYFGIGLQIANDIGDFVPHCLIGGGSLKENYDQYNDLRHGKYTLPIMHAFINGTECQRNILRNIMDRHSIYPEEEIIVTKILWETGSATYAKHIAKSYWRKAKDTLKVFPLSREKTLLSVMLSQVRSNKYYYNIKRINGEEKD